MVIIALGPPGKALTTYRFTDVKVVFSYFYYICHVQDLREDAAEPSQVLIAYCESLYVYMMELLYFICDCSVTRALESSKSDNYFVDFMRERNIFRFACSCMIP